MSHNKRSELKSPVLVLPEESKLFEKPLAMRPHSRPLSAKLKAVGRGWVPAKYVPYKSKPSHKKETDRSFLARLRPRSIAMDKERLHEENKSLRLNSASMREELLKLKARATQLEQESQKREEALEEASKNEKSLKAFHLVKSLKQSISSLKTQISSRESAATKLAKNIKSAKHGELELEIQAYIDECTRLRHHLEEIMRQREIPQDTAATDGLRTENSQLSAQVAKLQEESDRWRERCSEASLKNNTQGKNEARKLKGQVQAKMREEEPARKTSQGELGKLKKETHAKQLKIQDCEDRIREQRELVGQLQAELKAKTIPLHSELTATLRHVALRMQLHRLSKTDLSVSLFGQHLVDVPLSRSDLQKAFARAPFKFRPEESSGLAQFLLDSGSSTPTGLLAKLQGHLEDWEVFSKADEEEFDRQLSLLIPKNKDALKDSCKAHDLHNTGLVTAQRFTQSLQRLHIEFPHSLLQYVSLLFYSHSQQLDTVPYRSFIKAYSEERPAEDEGEEQKAENVRSYLARIAQALNDKRLVARTVFKADARGLVSLEEFISALRLLELNDIGQDKAELVLDSLQCEEEEDACVLIEELEGILEYYGVHKQPMRKRSAERGLHSLDSEKFEYTDDSPQKNVKSLSPLISDNSPFTSVAVAVRSDSDQELDEGSGCGSVVVKEDESSGGEEYYTEFEESVESRRSV